MVLQGFTIPTYIGWISGTLLIRLPSGFPVHSPIKSKFFIYAVIIYVFSLLVGFDFYIKQMVKLKNAGMVPKFLNVCVSMGAVVFDMYFRICFFVRGKVIPRFLKSLEVDKNKLPPLSTSNMKQWKFYKRMILYTSVYLYVGAALTTYWISTVIPDSYMYGFLPAPYYYIIFFVCTAMPSISSVFLSFAFVIVATFHIFWIFEDFCVTFEEQINLHNLEVTGNLSNGDTGVSVIGSQTPMGKEKLLSKFEHVKLLCTQYEKIAGPLLMGLMVRSVFVLIHSANAILLHESTGPESDAKYTVDCFHFLTELSQLVLLEMGSTIHRKIFERKDTLARNIILMNNIGARDQMKEVMRVVTSWDWEISGGPQFFTIERSLLSGVVSSLMTYIVILFQLNTSNENITENANITATTISPFTATMNN